MLALFKKIFSGSHESEPPTGLRADSRRGEGSEPILGTAYTIRDGRSTPTDAAFNAWTSGDLDAMLAAANSTTNKVDRHHLLQGIVEGTYKRRTELEMRALCTQYAEVHLMEFPAIAPVLKRQCQGVLPRVTTFQHYATVLAEDGSYDQAVEVCKTAIQYGLYDGTASGFEGRIARILKKRPQ